MQKRGFDIQADAQKFALQVFGYDSEAMKVKMKANKVGQLIEAIEFESNSAGKTEWAAFNGVTYYTNHILQHEDKAEFLQVGGGKVLSDRAFAILN